MCFHKGAKLFKLELSCVPVYHFVQSTCRILYNNVSSIVQKANFMKENQNVKISHVMVFSETWLTQEYPDEMLDMENFTLYHMDNLHNVHHGMVVYIHKSVTLQYLPNISDYDMEAMKVQIICKGYVLTIVGLYIQQQTSLSRIQSFMGKILSNVPDKKHVVLLGDFIKSMIKVSECYSVYHFMKTEYQCTQQIKKMLQENILE